MPKGGPQSATGPIDGNELPARRLDLRTPFDFGAATCRVYRALTAVMQDERRSRHARNARNRTLRPMDAVDDNGRKSEVGIGLAKPAFSSPTSTGGSREGQNTPTEVDEDDPNGNAFRNTVDSDVSFTSFALRMNYNIPIMSAAQFIIGVGGVRSNYAAESAINSIGRAFQYNYGVSGLVGIRFRVANRVALRVDGIAGKRSDQLNAMSSPLTSVSSKPPTRSNASREIAMLALTA